MDIVGRLAHAWLSVLVAATVKGACPGVLLGAVVLAGPVVPVSIAWGGATGGTSTQPAQKAGADLDARIAELIEQLGSLKYKEREAAQKALVEIGPPAVGALRKAALDKDPERAIRAKAALREIDIAALAGEAGRPCLAVAGRIEAVPDGIADAEAAAPPGTAVPETMERAAELAELATERLLRRYLEAPS